MKTSKLNIPYVIGTLISWLASAGLLTAGIIMKQKKFPDTWSGMFSQLHLNIHAGYVMIAACVLALVGLFCFDRINKKVTDNDKAQAN